MIAKLICFRNDLASVRRSEQWIAEPPGLPYRRCLGIIFGNFGGGFTKPKSFGIDSVIFLCVVAVLSALSVLQTFVVALNKDFLNKGSLNKDKATFWLEMAQMPLFKGSEERFMGCSFCGGHFLP